MPSGTPALRSTPTSTTATAAGSGKTVAARGIHGADSDTTRADDTIGYVVVEAGNSTINEVGIYAAVGSDIVRGPDNSPPYTYPVSGLPTVETAVASQAAMDGGNGSWAALYSPTPLTLTELRLMVDEDQAKDSERKHTTEQVAYIVFDPPVDGVEAAAGGSAAGRVDAVVTKAAKPVTVNVPQVAVDRSSALELTGSAARAGGGSGSPAVKVDAVVTKSPQPVEVSVPQVAVERSVAIELATPLAAAAAWAGDVDVDDLLDELTPVALPDLLPLA